VHEWSPEEATATTAAKARRRADIAAISGLEATARTRLISVHTGRSVADEHPGPPTGHDAAIAPEGDQPETD
jgi:hypothetical protein